MASRSDVVRVVAPWCSRELLAEKRVEARESSSRTAGVTAAGSDACSEERRRARGG